MKKLIVNVPEDLFAALARRKAETGVPTGEFIRRTLRLALAPDAQPPIETRTLQPVLIPGR